MTRLSIYISLLFFTLIFDGVAQEAIPKPVFNVVEHDFGDLKQGEKREFVYEFTNEGTQPFIISDVHVQCGCTATEWPTFPVLPNEKGQIKVVYNSKGKEGVQRKIITVKSNYSELIKLKVIANVITDN